MSLRSWAAKYIRKFVPYIPPEIAKTYYKRLSMLYVVSAGLFFASVVYFTKFVEVEHEPTILEAEIYAKKILRGNTTMFEPFGDQAAQGVSRRDHFTHLKQLLDQRDALRRKLNESSSQQTDLSE